MKRPLTILALLIVSTMIEAEEDLMVKLDTNNDGLISKAEAKIDPEFEAIFNKLDTNQDGFVSSNELKELLTEKVIKAVN
ncbi:hypothetical protein [Paraglaciecola aestuariivivens]